MEASTSTTRAGLFAALLLGSASCATPPAVPEARAWSSAASPLQEAEEEVSPGEEETAETPAVPPMSERPRFLQWKVEVEPLAAHYFSTGLSGGDADVATSVAGIDLKTSFPLSFTSVVGIETGYEWRDYDFDGASSDLPGDTDPLKNLQTTGLTLSWLKVLGDDWMRDWQFYGRGIIQGSFEDGASIGDSLSYGGIFVFGKAWSPQLRLGFGVGGMSQLEESPIAFPAIQFVWTPDEAWRLELIGLKLELERTLGERDAIALLAQYDYRGFRLRNGDPTFGGVFTDERIPLMLRYTHQLGKYSNFRVYAGIDVVRRLDFADAQGDQIDRAAADPAPTVGVSLLLGF